MSLWPKRWTIEGLKRVLSSHVEWEKKTMEVGEDQLVIDREPIPDRLTGRRRTKAGVEFHVKGFDRMSPESQAALETIVDAAAEKMEKEGE